MPQIWNKVYLWHRICYINKLNIFTCTIKTNSQHYFTYCIQASTWIANSSPGRVTCQPGVIPGSGLTLCSRRARFCCCSMRSEAEAGGEAALMLLMTRMLSSGRGGSLSSSRFPTLMFWSCSNPPRVNYRPQTETRFNESGFDQHKNIKYKRNKLNMKWLANNKSCKLNRILDVMFDRYYRSELNCKLPKCYFW